MFEENNLQVENSQNQKFSSVERPSGPLGLSMLTCIESIGFVQTRMEFIKNRNEMIFCYEDIKTETNLLRKQFRLNFSP